jgi:hypothetical protein
VAALLAGFGSAAADDPPPAPPAILVAARAAVRESRIDRGRPLGFNLGARTFTELPAEGALLVGFDCGLGRFFNIENVYALRPIYQTREGKLYFHQHGIFADRRGPGGRIHKTRVLRTVSVLARPGYAVGALTVRSGLNINGLAVTFMRITGETLDPEQSYTSAWIGDRTGGSEASVSANGAPVIGVHGREDDDHVMALGLMSITPRATAEQPAAEAPEEAEPAEPVPAAPAPKRPAVPPRADRPPGLRAIAKPRAQAPAEPPPPKAAEPPAPKAAEPAIAAPLPAGKVAETERLPQSSGVGWIAFVVGGAGAAALLFWLVPLGRKRRTTPPPLPAAVLAQRIASRPQGPAEEGILEVLPVLPAPRKKPQPPPLPAADIPGAEPVEEPECHPGNLTL